MYLPPLRVPAGFIDLLKRESIVAGPRLAWELTEWQNRFPLIGALAVRYFAHGKENFRWEEVLNTLPWPKLRASFAAIFISYMQNRYYPANCLSGIPTLEELALNFSAANSDVALPRAYLLAFYLHVATMQNTRDLLPFSKKVMAYASLLPPETPERDWIMIALAHFEGYLGEKIFNEILASEQSWPTWMGKLTAAQQNQMIQNLLAYAYSTFNLTMPGRQVHHEAEG